MSYQGGNYETMNRIFLLKNVLIYKLMSYTDKQGLTKK